MKKLLVVLALILLAVSPLFAQDAAGLKWSGSFYTSWRFTSPDTGDMLLTIPVNTLYFDFSFTGKDYGIVSEFDLQYLPDGNPLYADGTFSVNVDQFYAYASIFGVLKLTSGVQIPLYYAPNELASWGVLSNGFGFSTNQYDWTSVDGYFGSVLEILPIDGLKIGIFLDAVDTNLPTYTEDNLEFAAQYTIKGIGIIAAGYDLNKAGAEFGGLALAGSAEDGILWASFIFNGVENLSAQAKFETFTDPVSSLSYSAICASFGYKFPFGLQAFLDWEMLLLESATDFIYEATVYLRYNTDFGRLALHASMLGSSASGSEPVITIVPEVRVDSGDITHRFRFYLYDETDTNQWRLRYDFIVNF